MTRSARELLNFDLHAVEAKRAFFPTTSRNRELSLQVARNSFLIFWCGMACFILYLLYLWFVPSGLSIYISYCCVAYSWKWCLPKIVKHFLLLASWRPNLLINVYLWVGSAIKLFCLGSTNYSESLGAVWLLDLRIHNVDWV